MRISGFASGLDIDSMVKQLMTAQRVPLDRLNQQKQLLEWKREGYREASTKLVSFSNNTLMNLSLNSSTNAKKAEVSGASNVLTATATGAANSGVMNIEVVKLATSATVQSGKGTTGRPGDTVIYNSDPDAATNANEILINGSTIKIEAGDTINSLVQKINSDKKANVTAIYDPTSGGLSLTNKESGKSKDLTFSGDILDQQFKLNKLVTVTSGTDSEIKVNGMVMTQSSNRFNINGVDINLTGISSGQVTKIEVVQDTDKIVDNVKKFVEAYNDMVSSLNNKVNEERYRKYAPLTTEQKKDMTEDEIKLWESKAKSGMLKGDSFLQQTLSEMRTALMGDVNIGRVSSLNSDAKKMSLNLTQLGITTGTWTEQGKLYLDETKLKEALAKDPDAVSDFFGKKSSATTTTSTSRYDDTDGIYSRLRKISQYSLENIAKTAGTSKTSTDLNATFIASSLLGEQLKGLDDRISAMNTRLTMKETQFYKQFTAMEVAMNKYNSTSSSLSSFMS